MFSSTPIIICVSLITKRCYRVTGLIFISTSIAAIALFWLGTGKSKAVLAAGLLWWMAVALLSATGFFQHTKYALPRVMLAVNLPAILYVIWMYRQLPVSRISENHLLAVHMLRVPVELVLYRLFLEGKVPLVMTFKGWNPDIITGISAIVLLLYTLYTGKSLNRRLFRIWNIAGIIFLAIIVTIAVLSAPSPLQQFAYHQPNVAILQFPYTLLPGMVVPLVLLSHLLCLKSSSSRKTASHSTGASPLPALSATRDHSC